MRGVVSRWMNGVKKIGKKKEKGVRRLGKAVAGGSGRGEAA